jgi:hypothetical protein
MPVITFCRKAASRSQIACSGAGALRPLGQCATERPSHLAAILISGGAPSKGHKGLPLFQPADVYFGFDSPEILISCD